MPKTWTTFAPDMELAARLYKDFHYDVNTTILQCSGPQEIAHAFEQWASALEDSVDRAIRLQHAADPVAQPHACLPGSAKGRCQYRTRVPKAHPRVAPSARAGDYCPVHEATSMRTRRQVKQVRRLQTLQRGILSLHRRQLTRGQSHHSQYRQLSTEWEAIRRNKAFGPRFDHWLLGFEQFPLVPLLLPQAEWLSQATDLARHVCDANVKSEARVRQSRFHYQVQLDCELGGQRKGFAQLRPKPRPPVDCLPVTEERIVTRVGAPQGQSALYEVEHPEFLRLHCPLHTDAGPAMLREILVDDQGDRADMARIHFDSGVPPEKCAVRQHTQAVTSQELHREFVNYWVHIWWRDSRESSTDVRCWTEFLQDLPPAPPEARPVAIDMSDISLWERALKRLNPRRATGYDGFSTEELKGLSGQPLKDMVQLFCMAVEKGYPAHLARAKVHTLAKRDNPMSFADSRPITVFSTTYRLWTGIVARELLQAWAVWMPASIAGSMPGRCAGDIAYHIQCKVEEALLSCKPITGFSFDITKCFNNLPRAPVARLLKHLGAPALLVDAWMQMLAVAERCPVFGGSVTTPMGATTGVPEGDALSVVAMAAVCWLMETQNAKTATTFLSYVDNFSWLASNKASFCASLQLAQQTCSALKLPIDWGKSFCWATTPSLKKFLDYQLAQYLPEGVTLKRVNDATDLGVHFQFQAKIGRGKEDIRLSEGKRRLDKLRRQPRTVQQKNRLLLSGIWPQTFHGMASRVLPVAVVDTFRSKAAKALCHTGPSQSSALVLSMVVLPGSDPEVFMFVQAVMALRRAFHVQPHVAEQVLSRLAAGESEGTVVGPATALSKVFHKLGWHCSTDGWCQGPGMHAFSVKVSSRKQVVAAIQAAWTYDLHKKVAHRNGLAQLGALSPVATSKVFNKLPVSAQLIGANCVAGGHMSNSSKALWDPRVEPVCSHCGDRDTKWHRVFGCPFFSDIRRAFHSTVQWVQEHAVHWIHSATIEEHPDEPVARLLFRARVYVPPPPLSPLAAEACRVLYTDGSCTVPYCPATRHASWAIVEDKVPHIPTSDLIKFYQVHKKLYPAHHVVAQGLIPREQNIGRAEVVALLQVCKLAAREPHLVFHAHSDSTYAIGYVQSLPPPGRESQPPKNDLDLCEWTGVWSRPPNLVLHKVKSHADFEQQPTPEARHFLGNAAADVAAKQARERDMPLIYDLLQKIDRWYQDQHLMLESYLRFQAECAIHVATSAKQDLQIPSEPEGCLSLQCSDASRAWAALQPPCVAVLEYPEVRKPWLLFAPWPPWYTLRVWQWGSSLRWQPVEGPARGEAGITLLELLANFVATTGQCPPLVGRSGQQADVMVSSPEGQLLPLTVKDVVITLAATIRYLEKVSATKLMLATTFKRVKSLQSIGCYAMRRGYIPRPWLGRLDATFELVMKLVHGDSPAEALRDATKPILTGEEGPQSALHAEWSSLTEHQRALRRKALGR